MKIPSKRELQQVAPNHSPDIDFQHFMKLYKDYTKEPYLFLVGNTTLSWGNSLQFRKNLLWKRVLMKKIKAINNKIEKIKLNII